MRTMLFFVLFSVFLSGCCRSEEVPFSEEMLIERVMVNQPNTYTVFILEPGNRLTARKIRADKVDIFMDVPAGKFMSAKYFGTTRKDLGERVYLKTTLEIHIHSAKDLKGGEMDRGKFGIETNNPVE